MDKTFLDKITDLHNNDEHDKIISLIEEIPEIERDYDAIGLLARAYNNLEGSDGCKKAIELLLSVEEKGKEDSLWHFRLGYAYFYTDKFQEAKEQFEESLRLNPDEPDAETFVSWCDEEINQQQYDPEVYKADEIDVLEAHIQNNFGNFTHLFHEIVSPDIHVDIAIIDPTPERNYYTLVTIGMGAHRMDVPEGLKKDNLDRAELIICLPPDWKINDEDEKWYWPMRLLKSLARMPGEEETWFGYAHSISYSKPFAENVSFVGAILAYPCLNVKRPIRINLPGDWSISACSMPDGSAVNFFQVIPLYKEEMEYKVSAGPDLLWSKFGSEMSPVVDISRKNFCAFGNLDESDFIKNDDGRFLGYTTFHGRGGVYYAVNLPEGDDTEAGLKKHFPFLRETLEWLNNNQDEIEKTLVEADIPKLAGEWAAKGRKIENDSGECYMLNDGETVIVPVTEKAFCESIYYDGISIDMDLPQTEIFLYIRTSPDYFDGRYITIYIDCDKNIIFHELSDE